MNRFLVLLALSLLSVPFARAADWPDTFESRVEIVAIVQTINAEILASPSATRTLESWCGEHHMAPEAKIVAIRAKGAQKQPTATNWRGSACTTPPSCATATSSCAAARMSSPRPTTGTSPRASRPR